MRYRTTSAARDLLIQVALLGALALVIAFFAHNAYVNLQRQNIATGWRFLGDAAGFAVSQSLMSFSETSSYARAFGVGLLNTLLVAVLAIIGATVLGLAVGVARLSPNWLLSRFALCYVEFLRNVPLVLHLIFWYRAVLQALPAPRQSLHLGDSVFLSNRGFMVPRLLAGEIFFIALFAGAAVYAGLRVYVVRRARAAGGAWSCVPYGLDALAAAALIIALYGGVEVSKPELRGFNFAGGMPVIPEFVALFLGLALYTSAFIAEIVRAGLLAVARGQGEAALALGLSRRQTLKLVTLPQALRVIIPPLTSQYLNLTKNSSLGVAIGYPELFSIAGTINSQTGQALEVIAITMGVYLTLSLATSAVMNWYNARVALVER